MTYVVALNCDHYSSTEDFSYCSAFLISSLLLLFLLVISSNKLQTLQIVVHA